MAAPHIHAASSVKRFGGEESDYLKIHQKMDCSKGYMPDNRHRVLTHNMFWILEVMVPLFGDTITNSAGKKVSVKDICEQHVLEDFRHKFIPTPQDYIEHMEMKDWMQNGVKGLPSSAQKLYKPKEPAIDLVPLTMDEESPVAKDIMDDLYKQKFVKNRGPGYID